MSDPNWKLEDDYKLLTLTLPTEPPTMIQFDAAGIDELFERLGDMRAAMHPLIQADFPQGQKVKVTPDPRWVVEPDALLGNSILHIREPRFGWLHFWIPKEEARKLGELLIAQAAAPPPGQARSKPN
jgi:hypothetical protein